MFKKITVIYPFDPAGAKIGGVQTFLRGFITYLPKHVELKFIGVSVDKQKRVPGKWMRLEYGGREFDFFPVIYEKDENNKSLIPLSLRFTIALLFNEFDLSDSVLVFNRIEPVLAFLYNNQPKVVFIHSHFHRQVRLSNGGLKWKYFIWLYKILEKKVFSLADIVFCVCSSAIENYKNLYPENYVNKYSFTPTWADKRIFGPPKANKKELRKHLNHVSADRKWVLFVGRLYMVKAPRRMVDVCARILNKRKDVHFLVIGEGPLRSDTLRYIKACSLEDHIHFLGSMSQKKLASFYQAGDILLLTSDSEGMPRAVIEAQACGIPVVATDVGEIRRIIVPGKSGEIISTFDSKDLAEGIIKVLAYPRKYNRQNCLAAAARYTPDKILEELYERILNND